MSKAGRHPDMNLLLFPEIEANKIFLRFIEERKYKSMLDVGGKGKPKWLKLEYSASNINGKPEFINDDICDSKIQSNSFDVVYSHYVFEHLLNPFEAAKHCVRICKEGGLLYHVTVFSWPLHIAPIDCFRYTHTGLAHIFERTNQVKTIKCGYSQKEIPDRWIVTYLGEKYTGGNNE